eukprot:TRINITY_DN11856_c0_g1_i2.p1 TRINITY_DN11856_c0_g1~~TRINITY_DN11856_c0_g1_i2.p1  ORF type:complete len:207 (+),score=18.66 TRINITY_DN11856_c0_g1_i2:46-666(+)
MLSSFFLVVLFFFFFCFFFFFYLQKKYFSINNQTQYITNKIKQNKKKAFSLVQKKIIKEQKKNRILPNSPLLNQYYHNQNYSNFKQNQLSFYQSMQFKNLYPIVPSFQQLAFTNIHIDDQQQTHPRPIFHEIPFQCQVHSSLLFYFFFFFVFFFFFICRKNISQQITKPNIQRTKQNKTKKRLFLQYKKKQSKNKRRIEFFQTLPC